ncbi:hypothetical protein M3Y97_01136100 [Aphelenchoides bicaudatus]|nr:hypothetical protein M3Y97_01136100 [Aphelenchoides bicaudatus]
MTAKDRCLCGVSVHVGTQIVGWLQIIFAVLGIPGLIAIMARSINNMTISSSEPVNAVGIANMTTSDIQTAFKYILADSIISLVSSIITIVVSALLLYAYSKAKPGLYLPYLIWTAINLVLYVIMILIALTGGIFMVVAYNEVDGKEIDHREAEELKTVALGLAVVGFAVAGVLLIFLPINYYFFYFVPRSSYIVMKEGHAVVSTTGRQISIVNHSAYP